MYGLFRFLQEKNRAAPQVTDNEAMIFDSKIDLNGVLVLYL
jgi:hypothetical protein